ncbi:hypothetical protein [Streptomyces sp. NPDC059455]|uniref:hypothetical protein n=1 Tax=Streptomyces sp. NPDC059455 TaxID=3346837 RepID=UPI0036BD7EBE
MVVDGDDPRFFQVLPAGAPDDLVAQVLAGFESGELDVTVVYDRPATTGGRWDRLLKEYVTGRMASRGPTERVVLASNNGQLVTVPTPRHVRTFHGTVLTRLPQIRRGRRAGFEVWQAGYVDVAGWTAPRHEELRHLVWGRSVPTWFADFVRRYRLAALHPQNAEVERRHGGRQHAFIAESGRGAWLLEQWDREHPEHAPRG